METTNGQASVGERIKRLIDEIVSLHEVTGVKFFKSQELAWAHWAWLLEDSKRIEWNLTYAGVPNGFFSA
jgi:hypothetical protein